MIDKHAIKKIHVYAIGAMCSSTTVSGTKMKSQLITIGSPLGLRDHCEPAGVVVV
jgi:hypothetical protein